MLEIRYNADWELTSGPTPTFGTGPTEAAEVRDASHSKFMTANYKQALSPLTKNSMTIIGPKSDLYLSPSLNDSLTYILRLE